MHMATPAYYALALLYTSSVITLGLLLKCYCLKFYYFTGSFVRWSSNFAQLSGFNFRVIHKSISSKTTLKQFAKLL
jgi:hypothetical protein